MTTKPTVPLVLLWHDDEHLLELFLSHQDPLLHNLSSAPLIIEEQSPTLKQMIKKPTPTLPFSEQYRKDRWRR